VLHQLISEFVQVCARQRNTVSRTLVSFCLLVYHRPSSFLRTASHYETSGEWCEAGTCGQEGGVSVD